MNNDLISREALKKDLHKPFLEQWEYDLICEIIDNASTVDAIPNAEGYEMYNKGYVQGYERGKAEARPHGETNAELFKQTFGIYATELWSMSERNFLEWLNMEVNNDK